MTANLCSCAHVYLLYINTLHTCIHTYIHTYVHSYIVLLTVYTHHTYIYINIYTQYTIYAHQRLYITSKNFMRDMCITSQNTTILLYLQVQVLFTNTCIYVMAVYYESARVRVCVCACVCVCDCSIKKYYCK